MAAGRPKTRIYRFALWLGLGAAVLYGAALLAVYFNQDELLYQNHLRLPGSETDPSQGRFALETKDGETLDAIFLPAPDGDRPAVLYLHGNAATLREKSPRIKALAGKDFSVLAFDWRGFGRSTGTPSQQGLDLDADAAFDWLSGKVDPAKIIVLGESLGTGMAVDLAARRKFAGLVLEGAFSSTVDVAQTRYPIFPVRLLMKDQFRSDLEIGKITMPLLQQHGTEDHIIPIEFGEKLFALAPEPKKFIRYEGGHHNDLPEKYGSYGDLAKFADEVAGGR